MYTFLPFSVDSNTNSRYTIFFSKFLFFKAQFAAVLTEENSSACQQVLRIYISYTPSFIILKIPLQIFNNNKRLWHHFPHIKPFGPAWCLHNQHCPQTQRLMPQVHIYFYPLLLFLFSNMHKTSYFITLNFIFKDFFFNVHKHASGHFTATSIVLPFLVSVLELDAASFVTSHANEFIVACSEVYVCCCFLFNMK